MSRPRRNLRLFAAVYPPPDVAAAMLAPLERINLPPHRVTPAEQLHLTLQFIGDVPVARLEETIESVRCAAQGLGSSVLTPRALVALPPRGHARLVALELDAEPPLLELQRRLARRLARSARRDPGDRYLPHVTLCRFRAPAPAPALPDTVETPAFPVTRLRLMRSTLAPSGAVHHEVGVFALA